jgi:hypothetical protein
MDQGFDPASNQQTNGNQGGGQPFQPNPATPQPFQPPAGGQSGAQTGGAVPLGGQPYGTGQMPPIGMQGGMQGGMMPGGGFPPPPPMPAPEPEDTTPANFQIGKHLPPVINVKLPAHNLQFDEQAFLHLLAGSISLTKDEKKRIIDSLPKLRQAQIDELFRIFQEERRKFAELSKKHVEQLEKLEKQHAADWQDIELEQKAGEKKNEDEARAAEIRKQLGL